MRDAALSASWPLIRITPIPADPIGVAIAAIVSIEFIMVDGCRLTVISTDNRQPTTDYFFGDITTWR